MKPASKIHRSEARPQTFPSFLHILCRDRCWQAHPRLRRLGGPKWTSECRPPPPQSAARRTGAPNPPPVFLSAWVGSFSRPLVPSLPRRRVLVKCACFCAGELNPPLPPRKGDYRVGAQTTTNLM
eukprot:scaffold12565_cov121-Isochrysis_galbana.AAC.8